MKDNAKMAILFLVTGVLLASGVPHADSTEEIGCDARFVALANGVVEDTKTGLEWMAGPDVDTSYYQAVEWVRNLPGDGWRMPTARELSTLYRTPGKPSSITPLLRTSGIHVWPWQENEEHSLYLFRYMDPYGTRGFAVRSKDRNAHRDIEKSQAIPLN